MDCRDFYPMFLLYNRDRLTGFGWVAIGNADSPRYEHPPAKRLGVSRVTRTQCDAFLSFLLGHVRIFGDRVCVLARVLLGCVFLKCLWREHSYAYSMLFLECCDLGALIRLWHTFPQMPVACLVTCISQMLYAMLESARFALLRVSINEWKRSFVLSEWIFVCYRD